MNLTKSGAGKLTLSGTNTYGGDTAVTGGVLKVTSASACPIAATWKSVRTR